MERINEYDLTILMPCRDEEKTVGICVEKAKKYIEQNEISAEILVVNNSSTDNSAEVARRSGARVVNVKKPGYGRTLRAGLKASRGRVIIMSDCDTTYDFAETGKLYKPLVSGKYDVVIGNRYAGGMEKGAMPLSHYWGVKVLSFLARKRFKTDVIDFHCGLRGLTRDGLERIQEAGGFRTTGMEFATEMIAMSVKAGLRIGQVPVTLRRCRVERQSKLRTIRDGLRHLRYIFG
ncbi:Glycosyl transferase family 2 [Lachnospiraceae bacterium NE2001]|nr:Glycosyl transferase family 2 [Lachnospiraceae bacterium NE2001]